MTLAVFGLQFKGPLRSPEPPFYVCIGPDWALAPALCQWKMGNCHKHGENRQALVLNRHLHTNNVVLFCH